MPEHEGTSDGGTTPQLAGQMRKRGAQGRDTSSGGTGVDLGSWTALLRPTPAGVDLAWACPLAPTAQREPARWPDQQGGGDTCHQGAPAPRAASACSRGTWWHGGDPEPNARALVIVRVPSLGPRRCGGEPSPVLRGRGVCRAWGAFAHRATPQPVTGTSQQVSLCPGLRGAVAG